MENDFDLFDFAMTQASAKQTAEVCSSDAVETEIFQNSQEPEDVPAIPPQVATLSKAELRQAAMAFLASMKPAGIAANVPTRRSKYRVAAAGFWRPPAARKNNIISKTAIVVMYDDLDCCFSDCACRDERLATISSLQEKKSALESAIRESEPHLGASDDLFNDFRSWDYASSTNTEYRKLCRKLDKEIKALTQGSKLEYIRRAENADLCFLAIPENLLDPAAIPVEWGIVELTANPRGFKLVRDAMQLHEVTQEGRLQLALNIAVSAASAACFASGVDSNGSMRRPPRKRPYFFSREKK